MVWVAAEAPRSSRTDGSAMRRHKARRTSLLACAALLLAAWGGEVYAQSETALDETFAALWTAESVEEVERAVEAILATEPDVDAVWNRLRAGRDYDDRVPRGRRLRHRQNRDGLEHPYVMRVPADYDPRQPIPLRVYLHGGVMRPLSEDGEWWRSEERWVRDDAIVVAPASWHESVWWRRSQLENLAGIVNDLKRVYNIDENRVHMLGVSDGATGAYYHAFKATTPWAAFLTFIGHPAVLGNPRSIVDGEMHVVNLRAKPLFVINGARDRLYPAGVVEPYMRLFADAGIQLVFLPKPDAGHDLSWWDEEADNVEGFIAATPRDPLPDQLSWETESVDEFNRAHWLVIDELGEVEGESELDRYERVTVPLPGPPLGIDRIGELPDGAGIKVLRVTSNSLAAQAGLQVDDVIVEMGGRPTATADAARNAILEIRPGDELPIVVDRGGSLQTLVMRFPSTQRGEARIAFPHQMPSGRVELERSGNTVTAATRGVRRFTLLLSRDQFDLSQPITVVTNGVVVHEAVVAPDVSTLLGWATVDWDRSLLFDAALPIEVQGSR